MKIEITLPIQTRSEANLREHWAVKAKRAKAQRDTAYLLCLRLRPHVSKTTTFVITLTRVAPRTLDSDNLARSMKAVRDGIAGALKIDDGSSRIEWKYAQTKGIPRVYEVRIGVETFSA